MERQKRLMIQELLKHSYLLQDIPKLSLQPSKNEDVSRIFRSKATFMNKLANHDAAVHETHWKYCAQSVCAAPPNSTELARAYSERSRFLLHMRKYRDCVTDINRALSIGQDLPKDLKIMLLCRKIECSICANLGTELETFFIARSVFDEIDDDDTEKQHFAQMLLDVEKFMNDNPGQHLDEVPVEYRRIVMPDVSAIEIAYSENYGRHLVATRDIRVGEIVCAEELYASVQSETAESYGICSHCLCSSFTMVPCDTCEFANYCLTSCKLEAWNKYHDIECGVLRCMTIFYKDGLNDSVRLALRMVLMGLKEAGSIAKLREIVAEADACSDNLSRGFTNGEFRRDSFKTYYSLLCLEIFETQDYLCYANAISIVCLITHSTIFGPGLSCTDINDLITNEDVIFIAALLLKMSEIASINSKLNQEPCTTASRTDEHYHFKKHHHLVRGRVIAAYSSLFNHSCNPNVQRTCTDDNKILYYSVLPIQKGSQIFESYIAPFYSTLLRPERRKYLKDYFLFGCYCEACSGMWESVSNQVNNTVEHFVLDPKIYIPYDVVGPVIKNIASFIRVLSRTNLEESELVCKTAAENIETLLMHFPYPNPPILGLMYILRIAFEWSVGPAMISVTHNCKRVS